MNKCLNCGLADPARSGYCDGLCWESANAGWPPAGYKWPKSCIITKEIESKVAMKEVQEQLAKPCWPLPLSNKILAILSLCMVGCLAPIEPESSSEEIVETEEIPESNWDNGPSTSFGCGSVYQELEGPNGISLRIPVECVPFYIYKGDPFEKGNPFVGLQEQYQNQEQ